MKKVKAKEIEKKFDDGVDISPYLDLARARKPKQEQIHLLDREAKRLGVPRQSVIKVWIADRLEKMT